MDPETMMWTDRGALSHLCRHLCLSSCLSASPSVMDLEPSHLKIAEGLWTTLTCFMECRDVLVLKGTGVWFQILSSRDLWASLSTQTTLFSGAQLSPAAACAAENQSMFRGSEMIGRDENPMGHYCREVATISRSFKTGFVDLNVTIIHSVDKCRTQNWSVWRVYHSWSKWRTCYKLLIMLESRPYS